MCPGWTQEVGGAPGGIRTPDPLLRRQTLFPTELRAHPFLTSLLYYDFHRIFDFDFDRISWNTWNNCGLREVKTDANSLRHFFTEDRFLLHLRVKLVHRLLDILTIA